MGFILFDIVEELVDFGKDVGNILSEGAGELSEIITDGVTGKVDGNYKTSYQIKEEAQKIESAARRKFSNKKEEVENKLKYLENKENELYTKRKNVLSLLSLNNNKGHNLNELANITLKNNLSKPYFNRENFNFYAQTLNGPLFAAKRREYADEYLESAKDFRVEVDSKIAEMSVVLFKLKELEFKFEEEFSVLDGLERLYSNLNSNNKNTIYRLIESIMKINIIDCNVNINGEYAKKINEIKNICNNI